MRSSGVALGTGWHLVELCGTVGAATSWDLYRDGTLIVNDWVANTGTTPVGKIQIGDAVAKTFTVNFDRVILDRVPGENEPGDLTAPTTPGQPTGSSPSSGTITINWTASTDNTPPITYRVYRDGGPVSIGSTTNTTFTDIGLTPSSVHTYTVEAVDAVDNVSQMSAVSAGITVSNAIPPIFSDDFSSGNFTNWTTNTRLTIDAANGSPAAPSARAQTSNQSAFAYKDLAQTYTQVCMSTNVNLVTTGTAVDIFRLRTAANGAIAKALVAANGILQIRSDFASTVRNSGVALGSGWHSVELCGTVGAATTWDLLPRRHPDRERLGRQHRDDAGRPDPDRRRRGEDVHDERRPRSGGSGARREPGARPDGADDARSAERLEPVHRFDHDQLGADRPTTPSRSPTTSTVTAVRPRSVRRRTRPSPTSASRRVRCTPTPSKPSMRPTT